MCIIDYNTFVSLVLASNHVGLVDEGMCYASIIIIYTIPKILKHSPTWLTFLAMLAIYRKHPI
jgi:hypothetical protein